MSCGRIHLNEHATTRQQNPPQSVWSAQCHDHDFVGPKRDRRDEAVNDLFEHQNQRVAVNA